MTQKFLAENCDIPRHVQFFLDTRNFVEKRMVLYEIFRQNEAKKFPRRFEVTLHSIIQIFPVPQFFWNTKWFPHEIFRTPLDWNLSMENCDAPIMHKLFRNPKLTDRQTEGFPAIIFGTLKLETFDRKSWYQPYLSIIFSIPKIFSETEGFPDEIA